MSQQACSQGVRKSMPLERARRLCRDARVVPLPQHSEKAMRAPDGGRLWSPLVEVKPDSVHLFLGLPGTTKLFVPYQDVAWGVRRDTSCKLGLNPIWALAPQKLLSTSGPNGFAGEGPKICLLAGEAIMCHNRFNI